MTDKTVEASHQKLDLWTPYRDIYLKIDQMLYKGVSHGTNSKGFYNLLVSHKQSFICLLQNPPKNAKIREELKNSIKNGVTTKETGSQNISTELYQEVVVLSDMYELNELVALDLLCTAQVQMAYYPGLPRGLVAILLYYEGRKFIVSALKLLVHARKGVLWNMNIERILEAHVTTFTNQLAQAGIFNRIYELIQTLQLSKEMQKLQENLALGGLRHQRQVIDLFTGVRQTLSEIVYLWAAQTGLPKEPTMGLITYLRQLKPEEDSAGVIDNVSVFMLLAALYAFDLSVLHTREDGEEIIQNLPIFADKEFVSSINTELSSSKQWVDKGIEGMLSLSFAITISGLRLMPRYKELPPVLTNQKNLVAGFVGTKVFSFICSKILPNEIIYSDEIITRLFHNLFTDFIVHMFAEVKQLQIRTQESLRIDSIEGSLSLPVHFEQFMLCLSTFYAKDPLDLHYCLDYWCPVEANIHSSLLDKTSARTLVLYKFIKLSGDSVPGTSFVVFVNMLASLSMHSQAARYCFNLLKQNNHEFNRMLSWDHFFSCFSLYYNNLKQDFVQRDNIFRRSQIKAITSQEIEGLLSVLNLIKVVAEYDEFSRLALCEHPIWSPLTVLLGLVGCSVPIHFKANLILTLAALSKSPEIAAQIWNYIESLQILHTIPTTGKYQSCGIQTELEEVEARIEEYPLTQSFLKLLDVLTDHGIPRTLGAGPRQPGFGPYLTYLINSVFLKFTSRSYKNPDERWTVGCACLKLFEKFLVNYEPQPLDFMSGLNTVPGFHLMLLLNSKSQFLNFILYVIEEGEKLFAQYTHLRGQKAIETCMLHCLNVLARALMLQTQFWNLLSTAPNSPILTPLIKLLLLNNPRTGQPDHLICLSKYITYYDMLPKHTLKVFEILLFVTNNPATHCQFLNILTTFDKESKVICNGVVECLDNGELAAKEMILKILKQCLAYQTPNLSQLLLGFDISHDISQTTFLPPGTLNVSRTCLYSIFTILRYAVTDEVQLTSNILESIYEIIYQLYSGNKTSQPVMRFTQLHNSFFKQHVSYCSETISRLPQLSWLLKTLSVELKIACKKLQIMYLQELISLLTDKSSSTHTLEYFFDVLAQNYKQAQAVDFVSALRQVIQVLALYLPIEVASPNEQFATNIQLLKKLLSVAVNLPLSPQDAKHLSSIVLILMQNMKRCLPKIQWDPQSQAKNSDIFCYILKWLINCDPGCQNLRINLYVSLIAFIHIDEATKAKRTTGAFNINRFDTTKVEDTSHSLAANIPTAISKCGERLVEIVCQDCVGGHDVSRLLAMLTFSLLINISSDTSWITFMVSRGYLKYIIDDILKSSDELKHLLEPSFDNLRVLYMFKAKVSLLLHISNSKIGAEHILDHKVFACFSNLNVLGIHPDVVKQKQQLTKCLDDFIPSINLRYIEIFLPIFQLCNSTITSLSINNYSAVTQIMDFIVSHLNPIEFVLHSGSPSLSCEFLHELATVTSTIALVSRANIAFVTKIQDTFQNYNISMFRIQKHMLMLLSKFLLDDSMVKELHMFPKQKNDTFQTSDRLLYSLQIISNLFHYLRNIISNSKTMLFKPSLGTFASSFCTSLADVDNAPTLGTLLQHLINFITFSLDAKNTLTFLKVKLQNVPNMSRETLMDFVKVSYDDIDIEIIKKDVVEIVSKKIQKKQMEVKYSTYIIDSALYLLWLHLDHYMLQAIPRIRHGGTGFGNSIRSEVYGAAEVMWNVTLNDINNLKQGLASVFNESFSRQLLATTKDLTEVERQFIEMLLRKIKRLLQFVPVTQ